MELSRSSLRFKAEGDRGDHRIDVESSDTCRVMISFVAFTRGNVVGADDGDIGGDGGDSVMA